MTGSRVYLARISWVRTRSTYSRLGDEVRIRAAIAAKSVNVILTCFERDFGFAATTEELFRAALISDSNVVDVLTYPDNWAI